MLGIVLYHPGADPFRVWYGTDTRAVGLLLGAALAIAVPPWHMRSAIPRGARRLLGVIGLVTLAAIGWMFVHVNEFDPFVYRGGFVLLDLVTVGLILALVHPAGTIAARLLAWRPLVWIGRRSYGIYLWHWPIFVLTRPGLDVTVPGWQLLAVRLGGTLVAAELSYRLVEMPIRNGAVAPLAAHPPTAPARPTPTSVSIELTEHGPLAVVGSSRRRSPSARVALVSVAAVVVVVIIGGGMVRAKTGHRQRAGRSRPARGRARQAGRRHRRRFRHRRAAPRPDQSADHAPTARAPRPRPRCHRSRRSCPVDGTT